jgi:hypothetical protein
LVGPVIDPHQALFVVGMSADDDCVSEIRGAGRNFTRIPGVTYKLAKSCVAVVISVESSRSGLAAFKSLATLHLDNLALHTNSSC